VLNSIKRDMNKSAQRIIDILIINRDAFLGSGGQLPPVQPGGTRYEEVETAIDPVQVRNGIVDNGRGAWCMTDCEIALCVWKKHNDTNIMKVLRTYSKCVSVLVKDWGLVQEVADKTSAGGGCGGCKARAVEVVPEYMIEHALVNYDKIMEQRKVAVAEERVKKKEQRRLLSNSII